MDFLIVLPGIFMELAAVVWSGSMILLAIKTIFKKDRFTFRKTIAFAADDPKNAASKKKKFLVGLVVPLYWTAFFYFSKEGLYQYIDDLLSFQSLDNESRFSLILFLYAIAFSFYQCVGYLVYDGVPVEQNEV